MVKCPLSGSHTLETYRKEGMITMKAKRKLLKMFVLTLALAMVFSVTAFAGSSVSWTVSPGVTASGTCTMNSASTNVTSPMYVYVELVFGYRNKQGSNVSVKDATDNAGTSAHVYIPTPSDFSAHVLSTGYHVAGSSVNYTDYMS